ncbi:MAG: precorrin-6y C5,15-methyltransferase (decarboxylating) subunit CbiE [bacterium]
MSRPWLSIIGVGEDGPAGLTAASRAALDHAEIVFGARRHLDLLGLAGQEWPLPFSVQPLLAHRGQRIVVLASGDPFCYGVGGSLSAHLDPSEWQAFPAPSTFSLAAARLGWRLEDTLCLGLHAAPLTRLRSLLGQGQRIICLLRDGAAVGELASYLTGNGFGASTLHVMQALGGPRERCINLTAEAYDLTDISAPVCVAIDAQGLGLPCTPGLPDDLFVHDGQITKRAARALTLSALAPRAGEVLWDIGTGSGSIAIEFLLAARGSTVHALEADPTRAARARANADSFGLGHRFHLTEARAPEGLQDLPRPQVVFVGGGASQALLTELARQTNTRLVANAVTLETEMLLAQWHQTHGGTLLRVELADAAPLGSKRGWQPQRPLVQWSVTL